MFYFSLMACIIYYIFPSCILHFWHTSCPYYKFGPDLFLHKAGFFFFSQGTLCIRLPFQCERRGSVSGCKHLPEAPGVGLQLQYLQIHPQHISCTLTFCQSRGWGSRMPPACRDPHSEGEECGSIPYTLATSDLPQEAFTWTGLTTCLMFSLCLCIIFLLTLIRTQRRTFKKQLGVFQFSMSGSICMFRRDASGSELWKCTATISSFKFFTTIRQKRTLVNFSTFFLKLILSLH